MTLAQDYLERGVVYRMEGSEVKQNCHQVIVEHLKSIGEDPSKAKSYAEQFVFDEEVPYVVGQLVDGGHIDVDSIIAMSRLPSSSTWVEWPVDVENTIGCKMGILFVDQVMRTPAGINYCGLFFIMRTEKDGHVGCFGAAGIPIPYTFGKNIATAFWKDWDGVGQLPEKIAKDIKAFIFDALDALFLLMTPRVCELRHQAYSPKANRRRTVAGKLPLVEYKHVILRVGVGSPRYVQSGGGPTVLTREHAHKRLHRVIGHFRTYRQHRETPLVSFVPEHWRGDVELGVVLKTRHVKGGE